ncbi:hypothetical protein [Actinomadura montaniterrae]|uniref:hypothetical protein n=1 Tax=Actinomadura montaniterrae TaxID=1803903 RepID=UPI001CEFAC81|nr:hypothetical protein [Actinomadura montaniterrae]
MPTSAHELPLEMVRNRPELVPTILRTVFDLDILGDPSITSESFADLNPAELRCDATVLFDNRDERTHGVIVESQQRFDGGKQYSWPAYIALLRLRHKCGATLLVLCPDENSARRCAAPIDMGHPNWVLEPLTVHPGMLPPITDPAEAARMPELAVLSAPAHADGPHAVGPRLVHVAADFAEVDAPGRVVRRAVEVFGAVDVVVANHARSAEQTLAEVTADELDRCWAVNARASACCSPRRSRRFTTTRGRAGGSCCSPRGSISGRWGGRSRTR